MIIYLSTQPEAQTALHKIEKEMALLRAGYRGLNTENIMMTAGRIDIYMNGFLDNLYDT